VLPKYEITLARDTGVPMQFTLKCAWISVALTLGSIAGYSAERDALAILATIRARHLPFGTVLDPVFASADSDQIASYRRCGDSAIWTGHYLAAEAFRYKVTRAADALDNVKKAIVGIKTLQDVTGTNLLARCAVPVNSLYAASIQGEEASNGIYTNASAGLIWVGNTSRDQYSGVMFGLGVAYDMVDDPDVRSAIKDRVTLLVDFLRGHNWSVVMPDGKVSTTFLGRGDQMLSFLQVGRHVNPDRFSTVYDVDRVLLSGEMLAPIGLEVTSDDSYFKFNLDYINLYNLIRLESSSVKTIYEKAYDILRNHTAGHQNAFFNMIDRGLKSPDPARDAETLALLNAWLQRPRRGTYVDLHGAVPVCGDQACQPVPVPLRPVTDFLWQRNPFNLAGGELPTVESAGIDYILPYWMARFYGLATELSVHSAAASSLAVAPESIASVFGPNLASITEKAGALPLPTSLGGITLAVRDAAGGERAASLIYVSPGQINFVVPAGTAPGLAAFTIASSGAAPVSVTGTVQNVAPTLFSMSGNGMGVAAATAIRTQAANLLLQSPVPVFQCNASACVSTPIDLGVDTPVYLTLYGTGIRNRSSLSNVTVTINGVNVPVLYAGPQPDFVGLDQLNVPLTLNLRGSGEAKILVTVEGQISNTVTVNVK
jgi:uncharacterized protein (TIGR03437 family)